jgi:hypothetical protein
MQETDNNPTETVETIPGATEYNGFFYALEGGKYRVYDTAGNVTDNLLRYESLARLCIDGKVARAEALAAEHAEHAAKEAKRMEREGTLTPAELLRLKMGRKPNNARDII